VVFSFLFPLHIIALLTEHLSICSGQYVENFPHLFLSGNLQAISGNMSPALMMAPDDYPLGMYRLYGNDNYI
jgi:hypothetical protein